MFNGLLVQSTASSTLLACWVALDLLYKGNWQLVIPNCNMYNGKHT